MLKGFFYLGAYMCIFFKILFYYKFPPSTFPSSNFLRNLGPAFKHQFQVLRFTFVLNITENFVFEQERSQALAHAVTPATG